MVNTLKSSFEKNGSRPSGKVYLVGAGPGDPELITVKGLKIIEKADVILYDYLVNADLLSYAGTNTEFIFVGKKCGMQYARQEEINELLITKAREGLTVVRLKGGDPFVFGRGGEEAEALADAGIGFEIIPGLTAAISATAYAGIPVTHREHSSSFALITGHQCDANQHSPEYWKGLVKSIDTLVVYMGLVKIKVLVNTLLKHGKPRKTPVAVIEKGTYENQRTFIGTLQDIEEKINSHKIGSPALIVIGEVVRLRDRLNWFENPLSEIQDTRAS